MNPLRDRIRRTGAALALLGVVFSTVRVTPAGEALPADAGEAAAVVAAASPVPSPLASPADAAPAVVAAETVGATVNAPQRAPEGGDLTHLTFTATGELGASLVAPGDGEVAGGTSAALEVETVRGAGVELKVDDVVVPFSRIGKRTVDTKTGVTRYTYYGVALKPGPNDVALTPLGANDLRGATTVHRIFGPGHPATVALVAGGPFRADGATPDSVRVEARDAWGHHAASGSVVHVILVRGDARLAQMPSAAPAGDGTQPVAPSPQPALSSPQPGVQSVTVNRQTLDVALDATGAATVRLIPGLTPGPVVLRVESGDAAREARLFLSPNLRKPFVSGLISAGAGAVPGIPDAPDSDPDGTNSRRGRIALFGTGAMGNSLATFAYDTSNTLERTPGTGGALGTYDGDPADRPYMTTGDASTRRDDALSRDHLFARLDSGRASAMWGEFRASTGSDTNALGGFDQLVDGARVELNGDAHHVTAFAARNDVGYDRRVFAPTGLANGVALRPDIIVGSETIVLATVDQRTGAVLAQTVMTRGVDYSIEYATGQLHFIDVPLPLDDAFNPRQIVVTYEYDAPGNTARTVGGRAEAAFAHGALKLGVGYVNDTTGAGNVALASQDLSGSFRGGQWQIVHATSSGNLLATSPDAPLTGTGGSALHAQLTRAVGADRLQLGFDRTGAGYSDPFGGLSTPGLLDEHLSYAHKYAGGAGELAFDVGHQANAGAGIVGSRQTTASLRTRRAITKRFTVDASLERRIASSDASSSPAIATLATPSPLALITGTPTATLAQATANEQSTQASVGVDWRATSAVDLSVHRLQTLGGENDVTPAQTDAQLTYDLGKGGRAYLRERWSAAPVQSFAAATQALTAATGGTRATEIGFSRRLGNATTVDTSYLVDQTGNGSDVYAAMGVRERIAFGAAKGDAFFQHATAVGADATAGGFDLYGLTMSYSDKANRFRMSGSGQLRTGSGAGVSLSLAAAGAISPDFSLFATVDDARAAGSAQADERVGVAWRPSRSDAGVTVLQYDRQDGTGSSSATQSGVLSLEQVLRVRSRTEIVGRYAYKLDGDSFYAAHSSIAGLRVDQRVGSRFDVGAEVRRADVAGIEGAAATAFAVEGGVRLGDSMRLGLGYNLRGTADPSLATTPTHRGAYVTVTSVVDRLLGWGRR